MAFAFFSRATITAFVTVFLPVTLLAQRSATSSVSDDRVFEAIGLRPGMTVCEIGAGNGRLTIEAARIVGPSGHVYTSELGDDRVKTLEKTVTNSGLAAQITVVAGAETGTNFPDGACDAVFMRNVYHHFGDPATILGSISTSLKAGARLAIVDFAPPPGAEAARAADRGKDGTHGITAEILSRELREAGFEAVTSEAGTQRWFMVVVSKPPQRPF